MHASKMMYNNDSCNRGAKTVPLCGSRGQSSPQAEKLHCFISFCYEGVKAHAVNSMTHMRQRHSFGI